MTLLILVPTQTELNHISGKLAEVTQKHDARLELCGFGPIAAAARSAMLVNELNPESVILLGIAGTFRDCHPVGSAQLFKEVHCWGVGVGTGEVHQGASMMGFDQYEGSPSIGDSIELSQTLGNGNGVLLTSCSASADEAEAAVKLSAVPAATAEDMEGYGVALSCQLAGVPLTIVRGISNVVGDRNKAHWRIDDALRAATDTAMRELEIQKQ